MDKTPLTAPGKKISKAPKVIVRENLAKIPLRGWPWQKIPLRMGGGGGSKHLAEKFR